MKGNIVIKALKRQMLCGWFQAVKKVYELDKS